MFVSRKKIEDLERRIADLEREVQSQQNEAILENAIQYFCKMTEKGSSSHPWEEKKEPTGAGGQDGLISGVRETEMYESVLVKIEDAIAAVSELVYKGVREVGANKARTLTSILGGLIEARAFLDENSRRLD